MTRVDPLKRITFVNTVKYFQSRWDLHGSFTTNEKVKKNPLKCVNGSNAVSGSRDCLHVVYSPYLYEPIIDKLVRAWT